MDKGQEQKVVIESGLIKEAEFDETEYYQKEIEPRLMELSKLCHEKGIPFFGMTEFSMDGKISGAKIIGNLPGARCSDRIRFFMKLAENEEFMKKCVMIIAVDDMLHGLLNANPNGGTENAGIDRN